MDEHLEALADAYRIGVDVGHRRTAKGRKSKGKAPMYRNNPLHGWRAQLAQHEGRGQRALITLPPVTIACTIEDNFEG